MPSLGEVRVVHVITKGDYGGAQTHVVDLAITQAERGHRVAVVAGTEGPSVDRLREHGLETYALPSLGALRSGLGYRRAYAELTALLATIEPQLIHAHSSNAGLVARAYGRRARCPTVYTAHGWPFQRGAHWTQRAQSLVAESIGGRLGDAIICLNEAEAHLARRMRLSRPGAIHVVPNGLRDVPPGMVRRPAHDRPLRIVMVARFAPPKLHEDLIRAVAEMADRTAKLNFVGDGPELERSRDLAHHLLGDRVTFLGRRDDVPALLATYDVSVLWSRYEGMPISLLESMRAGVACVASDLPGTRDLFGTPPCGDLASTRPELVSFLDRSASSSDRVDESGAAARARYEREFTASTMADRVDAVYQSVLADRASVRR